MVFLEDSGRHVHFEAGPRIRWWAGKSLALMVTTGFAMVTGTSDDQVGFYGRFAPGITYDFF